MMFRTGGVKFEAGDVPDLSGKVCLVTGGNSGLGAETVKQLAKANAEVWLAARTQATAVSTVEAIKMEVPDARIHILELDLGSFDSVKTAADRFNAEANRLDMLVENAGICFTGVFLSESGYENMFGVNHMGHALLTMLLLPKMLETAKEPNSDVRVVILSSEGHKSMGPPKTGVDLALTTTEMADYSRWTRYGISKLATIWFCKALAARYPSITVASLHPGGVYSGSGRGLEQNHPWLIACMRPFGKLLLSSVEKGVRNQLWVATSKDVVSGTYYEPIGIPDCESQLAKDKQAIDKLWTWTAEELENRGYGTWP